MSDKFRHKLLFIIMLFLLIGCATTVEEDIERAQFALDRGDWDTAIHYANLALEADLSNVQAALALSSGYAGKSGFKLHEILVKVADFASRRSVFKIVHDALTDESGEAVDLDLLRIAIEVLTEWLNPQPNYKHPHFIDFTVKVAILLAAESYAVPPLLAQPTLDGPIDTTNITEAAKSIVQSNFIDVDNHFINSDLPEDDGIIKQVRSTYCVLQSTSNTTDGFDLAALQDLVLCQLSDDPDSLTSENGDFQSPLINSCNDFTYDICTGVNPTEL